MWGRYVDRLGHVRMVSYIAKEALWRPGNLEEGSLIMGPPEIGLLEGFLNAVEKPSPRSFMHQ